MKSVSACYFCCLLLSLPLVFCCLCQTCHVDPGQAHAQLASVYGSPARFLARCVSARSLTPPPALLNVLEHWQALIAHERQADCQDVDECEAGPPAETALLVLALLADHLNAREAC